MNFKTLTPKFKSHFFRLVKQSKNIVVTGHISPDDDAVSAMLALYYYLTSKYPQKSIRLIQTGQPVDRFSSFLNYDRLEFVNDLVNYLDNVDLLVCLDGGQYDRFTNQPEAFAKHPSRKICFDHHGSPVDKFDLSLVNPRASATVELVYLLLFQNTKITEELAEIILLGIFGDTGTFNYLKPHNLNILDITKKLLKISGIEIQDFKSRYQTIPIRVFEIIKEFIKNTKFHQLPNDQSYQTSFITQKFIDDGQYDENEACDASHLYVSHYLRTIEGYHWGFALRPKTNQTSISLRSLPKSVNVRDIVERMSIGGGHDRAAGGDLPQSDPLKALKIMIDWINTHKLNNS